MSPSAVLSPPTDVAAPGNPVSGLQNLARLSTDEWQQFQELADRFHEAWRKGVPGDLQPFLPPPGSALRTVLLHELITIDLEMRWRRGQPQALEHYLEKHPELGGADALPAALVFQEYHVRHRFGDRPALSTYEGRFPAQYEDVTALAMHQTFAPARTTGPDAPRGRDNEGPQDGEVISIIGGYKPRERIGTAAFGEVWSAEAPGGIPVALKVLHRPVDAEEARRELTALELVRGLRHPSLIQLHGFWSSSERLYIVMELADCSLRDRLEECRRAGLSGIPQDELLTYFRDAAEGLDYLHDQHVHHRDIKPENILIVQGHAKLADFGLAREHGSKILSTATGAGTPLYMAPEVFRGQISDHSDQYSLAMAYAELRLDRRLMKGVNIVELMLEHLEEMPDLSGMPEAEQAVIFKALSKEPQDRYPSCLAWFEALLAAGDAADDGLVPVEEQPQERPVAAETPPVLDTLTPSQWKSLRPAAATPRRASGQKSRRAGRKTMVAGELPILPLPSPRRRRRFAWAVILVLLLATGGLTAAAVHERDRFFPTPQVAAVLPKEDPARKPENPPTPPVKTPAAAQPEKAKQEPAKPTKLVDVKPAKPKEPEKPAPKAPPAEPPVLKLAAPATPLVLGTGEDQVVDVTLERNFKGPVAWEFPHTAGIKAAVAEPPAAGTGTGTVKVRVTTDPTAPTGPSEVTIIAKKDGVQATAHLKLKVVFVPPGFMPDPDTRETVQALHGRGKQEFFTKIRPRQTGLKVSFVLVPKTHKDDPDTFYMMADKASVGLFRAFVREGNVKVHAGWNDRVADGSPLPVLGASSLALLGSPSGQGPLAAALTVSAAKVDGVPTAENYPVFNVRVEDAAACARWLHGHLPSPEQWDKAAGFYDDQAKRGGPFLGRWAGVLHPKLAVGQSTPLPLRQGSDDRTIFGCWDMAGNGWEWTNAVVPGGRVPLDRPRPFDRVRLRGHSYQARTLLLYRDMAAPGQLVFGACPYDATLPDLGFRVAIDLPPDVTSSVAAR
jgi:serine/threonine protein kinase